ncbi:Tbc1 domain family member 23-like, partial [Globisporangium splendens]
MADAANAAETTRADALRRVLMRQRLRLWAAKSAQECREFGDELQQLFSSPSALSTASTSGSSSNGASPARAAITRRPGVEEVKNCILANVYAGLPPQCAPLRGEIWQVLLNVYKRNQHGSSAQEFDRMILRLGKLPRDPLLVEECAQVSALLLPEADNAEGMMSLSTSRDEEKERIQKELEILLVWFLTTKSVAYTSGMARVVAPFFLLNLPLPTIYDCFYQYCANFLPHLMNTDADLFGQADNADGVTETASETDSVAGAEAEENKEETSTASERQHLAEQLLSYHDPQLAHFLTQWCGNEWSKPGQVIPASFFLGDLYQDISPRAYTYVMDQILFTGDTLFGMFVLLAVLIHQKEVLMECTTAADVKGKIQSVFEAAFADESNVQFLCLLASRLRSRTPRSYTCLLGEGGPTTHSPSRLATEIAFGMTPSSKHASTSTPPVSSDNKKVDVDMTQWVKKESRSIAGKIFWYHTQTGKTQWEHPAEKHDPAPALFALPISVDEVAGQVMGEKTSEQSQGLRFFVIDCRGLRSSDDLKSGRIPAAYTLDPSVFDSPDLIAKNMEALNPLKSQVHIVLAGHGVGVPPELTTTEELKTSVRDAVRHDTDCINRAAIFFQKRGFRFVSCLDGGYSSWHAFMRDNAACSPQELLNHVESECHYCRYDTILRTGEDPFKKKAQQNKTRRKKSAMPTTTNMPVNGGQGDASIISTSSMNNNSNSNSGSSSNIGSGNRLSMTALSRTSMSSISSMRTKFADVKMPKLQWGRRSSATSVASSSASNSNNHHDSGSSSETATVDDGGSDRGSSATDELGEEKPDELDESLEELQAKLEAQISPGERKKSFVGVFTIDYSDDEEEHESAGASTEVPAAASTVAPTQSA